MSVKPVSCRLPAMSATAAWLALFCSVAQSQTTSVKPSSADYAAAREVTNHTHHAWRANTPTARMASRSDRQPASSAEAVASAPDSGGPRYPADLQYLGGPVVVSMESHAIYLNPNGSCTVARCWGNPTGFLRNLGKSDFIHVVDQYTGSTVNNRYRVAEKSTNINYTPPATPLGDNDILALVHAVVVARSDDDHGFATGYGNEYHVFLPPGQDECFNNPDGTLSGVCYSPDNPATFFFCAYHGSADFKDIGHVLYSVEPFQNADGCNVRPGTPNGPLADATNNSLSHETFETITDPDGDAWINIFTNVLFGAEIGDECSFLAVDATGNIVGFDPSNVTLNDKNYAVQPEYDNFAHACTTKP